MTMTSSGEKPYYSDFPTVPIGGSNPYSMCALCHRSVPEINGDLRRHERNCEYRIRKEKEILNDGELTMDKIVDYLKKNLKINLDTYQSANKRSGCNTQNVELEIYLGDELITNDVIAFEIRN
jgi:hypothetical protein